MTLTISAEAILTTSSLAGRWHSVWRNRRNTGKGWPKPSFLSAYPRAARVRTETARPVRAYRYKAHIIISKVKDDDDVLIVRVRHGREDWINDPGL